jgi:transposase InsO family protein
MTGRTSAITARSATESWNVDLSRFRSDFLRAILAIKVTGYGSDTQRRVQAGCCSQRADQWPDMALLAYIRVQHRLSLCSYYRPRMAGGLNELGLKVGQHRVGRLMRQNGIQVTWTRKFKGTADSDHAFNIAPNLLPQDFRASGPNQKWAVKAPMSGRGKAEYI